MRPRSTSVPLAIFDSLLAQRPRISYRTRPCSLVDSPVKNRVETSRSVWGARNSCRTRSALWFTTRLTVFPRNCANNGNLHALRFKPCSMRAPKTPDPVESNNELLPGKVADM
jgi:hypothetical protein